MDLSGKQLVYFQKIVNNQELQEQLERARLTLIAFFEYNSLNKNGQKYLY